MSRVTSTPCTAGRLAGCNRAARDNPRKNPSLRAAVSRALNDDATPYCSRDVGRRTPDFSPKSLSLVQRLQRDLDVARVAVALDRDLHLVADLVIVEHAEQILLVVDLVAVDVLD